MKDPTSEEVREACEYVETQSRIEESAPADLRILLAAARAYLDAPPSGTGRSVMTQERPVLPTYPPALTPEEWVRTKVDQAGLTISLQRLQDRPGTVLNIGGANTVFGFDDRSRRAIAALALHRDPGGFTQADVNLLRGGIAALRDLYETFFDGQPIQADLMDDLANRIEALLPPRET